LASRVFAFILYRSLTFLSEENRQACKNAQDLNNHVKSVRAKRLCEQPKITTF
jgi:hypothetical protein